MTEQAGTRRAAGLAAGLPVVILAGGAGRRMGGVDKLLLPLGGRRVADHLLAVLRPQAVQVVLNANGDPARFAGLGLPVLPDPVLADPVLPDPELPDLAGDRPGPLAGLLAALDWAAAAGHGAVVTVPGDAPFLPADLVARLAAAAGGGRAAVARGPDGRLHPTCGLWPVATRAALRAALAGGMRRVTDWTAVTGAAEVAFPPAQPDPFLNLNTPADLAAAEALLRAAPAGFDTIVILDWSGGNDRGPRPVRDAIWMAVHRSGETGAPVYLRNRQLAEAALADLLGAEIAAGRRVLAGLDFPFGYPAGFARAVTGRADPLALWAWYAAHLHDTPQRNDRFALAARLNALFPGIGPFWFNGTRQDLPGLPRKGRAVTPDHGLPVRRLCETRVRGAFSCWQMGGAGAVGSQAMTGMAALARLRSRFPGAVAVWPFQPTDRPVVLAEVWPSLWRAEIAADRREGEIADAAQVRWLAGHLGRMQAEGQLAALLDAAPDAARAEEGWILGVT